MMEFAYPWVLLLLLLVPLRPEDAAALEDCLHGGFVLAEDQLRTLSRLIGLPVLDDDILTQYLEEFEDF